MYPSGERHPRGGRLAGRGRAAVMPGGGGSGGTPAPGPAGAAPGLSGGLGCGGGRRLAEGLPPVRQEFVDALARVGGDPRQDVPQVGERVNAVALARRDETAKDPACLR